MVNHFVAASFLRLYFIIFSSAVSLLRKNAREAPYPHKTFNYIVLGGNPYTHYFGFLHAFLWDKIITYKIGIEKEHYLLQNVSCLKLRTEVE